MAERQEQRPLALRTSAGPVDLRPPRQAKQLKLADGGPQKAIKKGWLKDDRGDGAYQKAVKQAMMIAAEEVRLMDAKELSMTYAYSAPETDDIKAKIQSLTAGTARFTVPGASKKKLQTVVQHREDRKRETLVKISKKRPCNSRVERSFIIDNGELLVYRDHHPNAKVKAIYQLKNATCFFEDRRTNSLPKWQEGYNMRLRVICSEREAQAKSPLYLYSQNDAKIHRWKRAFTLAKVLVSENDRRALKVSIGRATSGALLKAWDALAIYYGEYAKTKALVKNMAMRLMKVDISRGWMKFKLVYRKKEEEKYRRKDQQIWAARFMSEKLTKLGKAKAKEIDDVREGVITRIQQRFRGYREDMIFDRTYPLTSSMMARVQQAKVGQTVDFSMQTVAADDVCHLSLKGEAWSKWNNDKDLFRSASPGYSALQDGSLPLQTVLAYASDNLSSLFFSDQQAQEGHSALNKTDWSKFINLDRVSSVILHTEPRPGAGQSSGDAGVWCTFNGPRVAWDRRLVNISEKNKELVQKTFGAEDNLGVASALAQGEPVQWVQLVGKLQKVTLSEPKREAQEGDAPKQPFRTKAFFHLMGWAFESKEVEGSNPAYDLNAKGAVPVSGEKFVCLDTSEVAVEVFKIFPEKDALHTLEWSAEWRKSIRELNLDAEEHIAEDLNGHRHHNLEQLCASQNDAAPREADFPLKIYRKARHLLYVGCEYLTTLFNVTTNEDGSPREFAQVLRNGADQIKLKMFKPGALPKAKSDEIKDKTKEMEEEVTAELGIHWDSAGFDSKSRASPAGEAGALLPCVSPELVGGGVNTTLFSCNRAAWFDPGLGAGKFRPDHVANYVELVLSSLTFPSTEKQTNDAATYYVRASICGITVSSSALHRSKPNWTQVLPHHLVDPNVIRFEGQRLMIPLPTGCWAGDESRRKVNLEVVMMTSKGSAPVYKSFGDFKKQAGAAAMNPTDEVVKFKARLKFDNHMLVDQQKTLGVFLAKPDQEVYEVDVFRPSKTTESTNEGMLSLEFSLRDRDQARALMGQPGHRSALCIGDKAMLIVEEPFLYPKDAGDFRKQFCVGDYSTKKFKALQEWAVPLREPCLSSEFAESGLGDLVPKRPFKQSFIPTFCDDIIPHKYVMPLSEKEFMDKHKPGFWGRVMDEMAKGAAKDMRDQLPYRSGPNKPVVSTLTHMNRHVPVTLLATYADGTCDVEVTSLFVQKWRDQPHRKFAFPGVVEKCAERDRFVLRKVPQILLSAVHYSGINVYDAAYKTTLDVINSTPPVNEFDPRSQEAAQHSAKKDSFKYKLPAGPLPPDASLAACLYEFSVRVRFPSEFEMYQFVAMVRKCVRVDHYQQASKMLEYQKQTQLATPFQQRHHGHKSGGQLDVVLMEARRLKPLQSALNTVLQSDPITLYESWSKGRSDADPSQSNQMLDANYLPELVGTTDGQMVKGTPQGSPIGTFVNFRMLHNKEVIPNRGTKVQVSPVIDGTDSPCWAKLPQLEAAGGWTFRTGTIDPEKFPKLLIEFEVMQAGIPSASRIGVIQLPVTEEQFLTNPNQMFKNLWLPLVSVKDGELTPNVTGEIHILTRWLPADMKQVFADGQEKMQLSVRSMFLKEIWSKVCQPRIREPLYGLEAMYHGFTYNPNIVRSKGKEGEKRAPEAMKDNLRRHVEELANQVPYLECLERRQLNAWNLFQAELQDRGYEGRSIGELRLLWQQNDDLTMLNKLQSLVLRGVPSALRPQIWAEVTLASRVAVQDGAGAGRDLSMVSGEVAAEEEYQALLQRGLPQLSDAMLQLQEDAVLLSGWETNTPPLPEAMELHLKRIKHAKNVVTALLAVEDSGVTYCESLLVLSFFLLLPQGYKEVTSSSWTGDGMVHPTESSVFWLLYTLVCTRVNGMYREYYGVPLAAEETEQALVSGSGAMQDVNLLECAMAYHEKELFQRMTAMGFDLSTVFYGAFMRWFATYMPVASVFRLWDALLLQSTNPKAQPHGRAYLIDLGFAALRAKRTELMNCQSALEMRSVVLGFLASLYDTSTVVDLIHAAHLFLWGGGGFSSGKVAHLWTQREELFAAINAVTKNQNRVLKILVHEGDVGRKGSQGMTSGISTKQLTKEVIPALQVNIEAGKRGGANTPKYWAMHRPMPLADRSLLADKAFGMFSAGGLATPPAPKHPFLVKPAASATRQPGLEPQDVRPQDMLTVMQRETPGWASASTALWQTFSDRVTTAYPGMTSAAVLSQTKPHQTTMQKLVSTVLGVTPTGDPNIEKIQPMKLTQEGGEVVDRVSLNEIYSALICGSRGTVAEKATALFDLYSYTDSRGSQLKHITPSSRVAKQTAASALDSAVEMSRVLAPSWGTDPDSQDALQNNVLKFTVYTSYPKEAIMGHVLIASLSPYISFGSPVYKSYNIWGAQLREGQGQSNMANNSVSDGGRLVCLGEIHMALQWTPRSIQHPEKGQLTIHVKHIKFQEYYILEPYNVNPYITVHLSSEEKTAAGGSMRSWGDIKRWDPRGVAKDNVSLAKQGAFGGVLKFDRTMKAKTYGGGGTLGHWIRHGDSQGWTPSTDAKESGRWEWNDVWGKQSSKQDLQVLPDFVQLSSRKNSIDMSGVRLLISQVLQRCMLNMTNRQAVLVADSIFNRAGAVPGICQAILAPTSMFRSGLCAEGLPKIVENFDQEKTPYVDVTREIVLEHERQCTCNGGLVNLFAAPYMAEAINLQTMGISDPYPRQKKTLFVRYVRAGDGQRCTQAVQVEANGDVGALDSEVKMDLLTVEGEEKWSMSRVTKEEFIACFTSSPLLSESMRRLGSTSHVLHETRPIALEVTIMDPHQDDAFQDLEESINIGQSLLVEVWDSDFMGMDFLGEAWLPPLSEFGARPKDIVLPLHTADYRQDAENGPSRPDPKKDLKDDGKDPNKKVTGDVFLSVSWIYPTIEGRGLDVDVETWLKHLETKSRLKEGDLTKYQEEIIMRHRTVRNISQTMVKSGKEAGELKDEFFTGLKMTDKSLKTLLNRWFKEQLAEDLKGRAHQQELKHTGLLTITIERAERLRRADAKKMRDCDPKALLWVRNDVKGAWRKKPLMQTTRISNDRNPRWEFSGTKSLFSGHFEAQRKPPPEGWGAQAGQLLQSRTTTRKKREEQNIAALRRFGAHGLKVEFGVASDPGASEPKQGSNHAIPILLTDTVRDFKEKLSFACQKESEFWKARVEQDPTSRYADIEIGNRHLVMAYVPSDKVAQMQRKGLQNSKEYRDQYAISLQDPTNWQPLDYESSFSQYVHMFGFGKNKVQLRVVEATEGYKAVNLRYKKWIEDKRTPALKDLNDPDECYGWAQYVHKDDSSSVEWRPAILRKSANPGSKFEAKWIFEMPSTTAVELDSSKVLLAPRAPKIDDQTHPRHREVLKQAKLLRSSGKSDWEIEAYLNKVVERQWEEAVANNEVPAGEPKPPRITIDQIRAYLQRMESQAVGK